MDENAFVGEGIGVSIGTGDRHRTEWQVMTKIRLDGVLQLPWGFVVARVVLAETQLFTSKHRVFRMGGVQKGQNKITWQVFLMFMAVMKF